MASPFNGHIIIPQLSNAGNCAGVCLLGQDGQHQETFYEAREKQKNHRYSRAKAGSESAAGPSWYSLYNIPPHGDADCCREGNATLVTERRRTHHLSCAKGYPPPADGDDTPPLNIDDDFHQGLVQAELVCGDGGLGLHHNADIPRCW